MTEVPENVMETQDLIPYILSYTSRILTDEIVKNYSKKLEEYINNVSINADDHILNIIKNLEHPICPRCGKSMVLRTARKGSNKGSQFWGCSNFPSCRITKELV
ncbi:MAG: topoisomerase DNA-binding C4 zinc finger domain-containing protein [bacterium]|nr:topoisomerase DNA-binding C4 zinc finger domain-containing protein [bacterium]